MFEINENSDDMQNIEQHLMVKYAGIINQYMKEVADDPIHACCSCERLFKRSQVTAVEISGPKWVSDIWQVLFVYMLGCEKQDEQY